MTGCSLPHSIPPLIQISQAEKPLLQASIKSLCIHHRTQFRLLEGILPSNQKRCWGYYSTLTRQQHQHVHTHDRLWAAIMEFPSFCTAQCIPRLYEKEIVKIHIKSTRYIMNTMCWNYGIVGATWKQNLFSYGTDEVSSSKLLAAEQGQTDKCLGAKGMWHMWCKILSVWPIKIFHARQVPRATTREMTKSLDGRRSRASWPT